MSGDTQGECLCVYAIIQDMILGALETLSGLQDERAGNQCLIVVNFQEPVDSEMLRIII